MSDKNSFVLRELPIEQLQGDVNQPRKDFGINGDENRLLTSMRDVGLQQPLVVKMVGDKMYTIIDGHRRYMCAQRLGMKSVPCRIYQTMKSGEHERVRFEVQNNRRDWKPMEKAEAIAQAKAAKRFTTNREVARYLHLAPSTVSAALSMRNQSMNYVALMEKYDLPEAYRVEIGRLTSKVRKIKELEPQTIIEILLDKVQKKVITRAVEFRVLKRIFLRATANEEALYNFLKEPSMTIRELERITFQSGTALLIDKLFVDLSNQEKQGEKPSVREKTLYAELRDLLERLTSE